MTPSAQWVYTQGMSEMFVFSPIKTLDDKVFWGECGAWKCQHVSHDLERANACLNRHLVKDHDLKDLS